MKYVLKYDAVRLNLNLCDEVYVNVLVFMYGYPLYIIKSYTL
jgi:hypothetical protein